MTPAPDPTNDPFGLNPAQRKAAYDLDHHVVLGSGAGCGKTRVLVARAVAVLSAPGASVGDVAAITFTEKAAGEMVRRLRLACRNHAADAGTADERRRWRAHLRDLERARISTIHAFCGRLLREHAAEAGVDPRFTVLDALPASIRRQEVIADVTAAALAADENDARLLAAQFGLDGMRTQIDALIGHRAAARRVMQPPCATGETGAMAGPSVSEGEGPTLTPALSLEGRGGPVSADALLERWRRAVLGWDVVAEARATLERHQPAADRPDDKRVMQRRAMLDALDEAGDEADPAVALGILHEAAYKVNLRGGSKRCWDTEDAFNAVKEALVTIRDSFRTGLAGRQENAAAERRAAEVMAALWRLFERCDAVYAEGKLAHGELDFDDLLIGARDLLRDHDDARTRIRGSMRHLLVDELQDTDSLQLEIVRLIVGDGDAGPTLFAVGDPKQSIYRFRGAEVEVFRRLSDLADQWATGVVHRLDRSYRTHAAGIAFFNGFFERLFGADQPTTDYEVAYEAVESGVEGAGPPTPVVSLVSDAEDGEKAAAGRLREADRIARSVRHMVETERPSVRDPATDAVRPAAYGDVAMLLRSFRDVGLYERAFETVGVPFYTVSGRQFFGRAEVKDVLLALKVIDSAHDEISLIGLLRSPLVGLSDETLLRMREKRGSIAAVLRDLTSQGSPDGVPRPASTGRVSRNPARPGKTGRGTLESLRNRLDPQDYESLAAAGNWIAGLRAIKDRVPIPVLIERLLAETGYDAGSLTLFAGRRRLANLRRLVDLAADLEGAGTLAQVIARLDDLVTTDQPGTEAAVVEEAENVVRLMTVHAAKGLEFPVVIVPDLGRLPNRRRERVRLDKGIGLVSSVRTAAGDGFTPAVLARADGDHRLREEAEDRRTFYVAATRARDRLVLSGIRPASGGGPWLKWFDACSTGLEVQALDPPAIPPAAGGPRQPAIDGVVNEGRVDWPAVKAIASLPARAGTPSPLQGEGGGEGGEDRPLTPPLSPEGRGGDDRIATQVEALPEPWRSRRRFTAREFVDYETCPYAYRLRHLEGFPDPLPTFTEAATAVQWGRVAHAALQRLDLDRDAAGLADAVAFALAEAGPLLEADEKALRGRVECVLRQFLDSNLCAQVRAGEHWAEVPFVMRVDDALVRGRIDLLWRDPAGQYHIVDYKADRVTRETVAERAKHAELQMQVYALAAARLMDRPPAEAVLYYLSLEEPVAHQVDVSGAEMAEVERRLRDRIAKIRAGAFEPRKHEGCAFCGYRSVCGR